MGFPLPILIFLITSLINHVIAQESQDIQFNIPDITVDYPYQQKSLRLEAFKISNQQKWLSLGYPMIVNTTYCPVFQSSPESIAACITMLNDAQKEALIQETKRRYPNQNIQATDISLMPLIKFDCAMTFYDDGIQRELKGNVKNFHQDPLMVRFSVRPGSLDRLAFERRLKMPEPIILNCEVMASGMPSTLKTATFQFGTATKLLGPDDLRYVLKSQLITVSQEFKSQTLLTEMKFEMPEPDFSKVFIKNVLENCMTSFQKIQIHDALSELSMYAVTFDKTELTSAEIVGELSDLFQIQKEGNMERIVAKIAWNDTDDSTAGVMARLRAGGNTLLELMGASSDISFVIQQSEAWKTISLDDQWKEINQYSGSPINWHRQGNAIVPKSLEVVKVTKPGLDRPMTFTYFSNQANNTLIRNYELSTADLDGTDFQSGTKSMHSESMQQLNQTMLDMQNAFQTSMLDMKNQFENSIAQLKSEFENSIQAAKTESQNAIEATKTSVQAQCTGVETRLNNSISALNTALETKETSLITRMDAMNNSIQQSLRQMIALARITVTRSGTCGSDTTSYVMGQSIRITSPSYPSNYQNYVNCIWIITAPNNMVVKYRMDDFRTEQRHDILEIRNGGDANSGLLASLSGAQSSSAYTATGNRMWIKFNSDASVVERGFSGYVEAIFKA